MLEINVGAKINWTLDILGKFENGYHELDMLMHSVRLYDTLTFAGAAELSLEITRGPSRHVSPENLVLRAARALLAHCEVSRGARITLQKRIPISAGMGGGSADAAATLVGLNHLWSLGLSLDELAGIGLSLGADVPFFLRGGLQRATGIGEKLQPLPYAREIWLVILHPCRGLSTKEVYGGFSLDTLPGDARPDTEGAVTALAQGDLRALAESLGNALEPTASALRPEIPEAIEALRAQGALGARMTGSGCAVFGIFPAARSARAAWLTLRRQYRRCYMVSTARSSMEIREIK